MVLAPGDGPPLPLDGGAGPDPSSDDTVELYDPPSDRRAFSPADTIRLVVGLGLVAIGVLVSVVAQETVKGVEEDLVEAFNRLPDALESFVLSLAQLVTSFVPAVAIVVLVVRRRWRVALLLVLAGGLANVLMVVADALVIDRRLADALEQIRDQRDFLGGASYPSSAVLATTTAVVTVAAPWVSRRWRRALWWAVAILAMLRLLAVAAPAFDLILALGVGTVVGSLVLLVFGSPSTEPRPADLLAGLRAIGLRPRRIDRAPREAGSSLRYVVVDEDGDRYDITLRTPEDHDADLLNRTVRALRYQPSEVGDRYSTLQRRLEHEALLLTLSERAGVRVPAVDRLGTTSNGAVFLVTRAPATRPATSADLRSVAVQADAWTQVRLLHGAGIAHRHLALDALDVDEDGRVWLADFDVGQTAPSNRELARDVAELLVETAVVSGPDAAVDTAVAIVGKAEVAPALRMLQPLALPATTRARAKEVPGLLDDLRDSVNRATGEPGLGLARLERVRPRTLLIIAASTLAFYSLLPQLANLGDTVDSFQHAEPLWIVAAVLASAVTYLFAAVSFQGAVFDDLPFGANVRVQVASSFATLVGPGGAGGYALGARFLQRTGVGGPEAAAAVAVRTIAGFAMHVVLLVGFLVWAGNSDFGEFHLPSTTTVLLIIVAVLAIAGVLAAIGPVRQRFLVPAWQGVKIGVTQIGEVFRRPVRVAELFGGSTGLSLTYVVALTCSIEAFGGHIGFAQIGASYLAAVAIATFAPTPGGLGAMESALIAALVGFGLPDGVAVSSVLTFRLATFWLPIVPGWGFFGWMQRNDEL